VRGAGKDRPDDEEAGPRKAPTMTELPKRLTAGYFGWI
jgi:hypothetical protein